MNEYYTGVDPKVQDILMVAVVRNQEFCAKLAQVPQTTGEYVERMVDLSLTLVGQYEMQCEESRRALHTYKHELLKSSLIAGAMEVEENERVLLQELEWYESLSFTLRQFALMPGMDGHDLAKALAHVKR